MNTTCRSCGAGDLELVLSLGDMPLANALLTKDQLGEPEAKYPLDLAFCPECTLLQITETVPPEAIFCDYPYLSSFSELDNARDCVASVLKSRHLTRCSQVMEVGSNDGYLLQMYAERGVPVLGIDPAANIIEASARNGVPTICEFFGLELAERLRAEGKCADIIHGNNVLAHVADLNGFVAGLRVALKDDGMIVIQVPYARDMIERVEFDTIYHEHLCYFSVMSLYHLLLRNGLAILDIELLPIHGGTLRLFIHKREVLSGTVPSDRALSLMTRERRVGMHEAEFYTGFGERVRLLKRNLNVMLGAIRDAGHRVAGYAASAKGSTLLNYCGIGRDTLDYVVDNSTVKQGRYTPGTHLLIEPPAKLLETQPDYALLLAWNHAKKIMAQETEYLRRGGRFIVPVPEPRVCAEGSGV